ncbi:DapH/DapD/GlmU-related protein [Dellaglioa sp. P0083]|uniref:DapH/DapD/GlmU-related protein n=1 Tax=Dellaglioa kimchii TaxID=3344667 RepID=UPI0038D4CDA5
MTNYQLLEKIVGKEILPDSTMFKKIHIIKNTNDKLLAELNTGYHTPKEIQSYLKAITDKKIDSTVSISLPFYTDFGKHISFGKNIFINQNVTFIDLGGIVIEDDVLIGPMSRIITVNHLTDPKKRRGLLVQPVRIKRNVWVGANVTILPGVTIGENSIIAADSTVTKDIPENCIVAGTPAKVIKKINVDEVNQH